MDEVVLLEVRQLSEGLGADRAPEGSLAAVRPQVNLQIGELPEDLVALLAPVLDLAVLLLQRVRQRLVPPAAGTGVSLVLVAAGTAPPAAWRYRLRNRKNHCRHLLLLLLLRGHGQRQGLREQLREERAHPVDRGRRRHRWRRGRARRP